jgi:hypothetical protein
MVMMALYNVLQMQSQSIRQQTAQIAVAQGNRTTLGILAGELREVDAEQGDLISASTDSLTVRVVRKLGIVCRVDSLLFRLNVWQTGDAFAANDSISLFVDTDTTKTSDDAWRMARVTAVDTLMGATDCPVMSLGSTATSRKSLTLLNAAAVTGVRRGALLRSTALYTYGLYQKSDQWVLGRQAAGDTVVALIGPLQSSANRGLVLSYYDTLGVKFTPTTAAERRAVRRVGVTVRGINDPTATTYTDSLFTQIFLRNE